MAISTLHTRSAVPQVAPARLRSSDPPDWVTWHSSAPDDVSAAPGWHEGSEGWRHWRRHLLRRRRPRSLARLVVGRRSPLLWSLSSGSISEQTASLIQRLHAIAAQKHGALRLTLEELRVWLDEAPDRPRDLSYALECAAWCHAMPHLARDSGATLWWALLEHLVAASRTPLPARNADEPLTDHLLCGELPTTISYLLPEIEACRDLARAGAAFLDEVMQRLIDRQGWPHARNLPYQRPLLACWTRMAAMDAGLDDPALTKSARQSLRGALLSALRLTRFDGGQLLRSEAGDGDGFPRLIRTALDCFGARSDWAVAGEVLSAVRGRGRSGPRKARPNPASQSEWSELAVLRSGWDRGEAALAVTYHTPSVLAEFVHAEETILAGAWELVLRVDGRLAMPTSGWEQVCWTSDRDADYLELEMRFGETLRVQRHLLLARRDRFLLLADSILPQSPCAVEYEAILPVAEGIACAPREDTREIFLRGRRNQITVLPLRLPEWRRDHRGGDLRNTPAGLALEQKSPAGAMFAPLFFDFDPRRQGKPLTWRHLTVAEQRRVMPPHVADGYRVQVGKRQWLIYRSLTGKANRTILGQNLVTEFIVARFRRTGTIRPVLEIEIDE